MKTLKPTFRHRDGGNDARRPRKVATRATAKKRDRRQNRIDTHGFCEGACWLTRRMASIVVAIERRAPDAHVLHGKDIIQHPRWRRRKWDQPLDLNLMRRVRREEGRAAAIEGEWVRLRFVRWKDHTPYRSLLWVRASNDHLAQVVRHVISEIGAEESAFSEAFSSGDVNSARRHQDVLIRDGEAAVKLWRDQTRRMRLGLAAAKRKYPATQKFSAWLDGSAYASLSAQDRSALMSGPLLP
jgi:hypothetical protein